MKTTTIIPYNYTGFNYPNQKVFVLKDSPSPDPLKKMLWGDGTISQTVSDFKGFFEREGKAIEITYTPPKYATSNQEKAALSQAVKNYITQIKSNGN